MPYGTLARISTVAVAFAALAACGGPDPAVAAMETLCQGRLADLERLAAEPAAIPCGSHWRWRAVTDQMVVRSCTRDPDLPSPETEARRGRYGRAAVSLVSMMPPYPASPGWCHTRPARAALHEMAEALGGELARPLPEAPGFWSREEAHGRGELRSLCRMRLGSAERLADTRGFPLQGRLFDLNQAGDAVTFRACAAQVLPRPAAVGLGARLELASAALRALYVPEREDGARAAGEPHASLARELVAVWGQAQLPGPFR